MKHSTIYIPLIVLLLAAASVAQAPSNAVHGTIRDADSGEPLPYTNVFLANTTIGVASALDGSFNLTGIPAGTYQLIVNRVGYKLVNQEVIFTRGTNLVLQFKLEPQLINGGEVQVIASEPREWKEQLKLFTSWFIGETENASRCTILNPEVLQFQVDRKTHELLATSDSTVRIQNRSLGYQLSVVFDKFRWSERGGFYSVFPHFSELPASDEAERKRWEQRRRDTYLGSFQHFIISLALRQAEDEGFMMQLKSIDAPESSTGRLVTSDQLVFDLADSNSDMKKLQFPGYLYISYQGRQPGSYLQLEPTFVLIDPTGYIYPPLALKRFGVWAKLRIADTLPLNYKP